MHRIAVTLEQARAAFLAQNGFSLATYDERWARVRVAGIPIIFPNVRSRRRAIRFHDLHHVLTGYATTLVGEAEIGAWEIAATFGDRGGAYWAAWLLNSMMFMIGLLIAPRRVVRAFKRGRRCTSLYRLGWSDAFLARNIEDVRRELGLSL